MNVFDSLDTPLVNEKYEAAKHLAGAFAYLHILRKRQSVVWSVPIQQAQAIIVRAEAELVREVGYDEDDCQV